MPAIGAGAGAAIAGVAGLLGTGTNAVMQGKTNRATRQHNLLMAGINRKNALKDWQTQNEYNEGLWNKQNEYNERVWHMMNDYNSPMAQMARFKEAGLNPNLIYGQGNTTGSISTGDFKSDNISPTRVGEWNPKAPTLDIASGIASFNATRESAARTNNLEEQNKLIGAQALDVMASTKKKGVETANMERLIDYQIDGLKEDIRKKRNETNYLQNKDNREERMTTRQVELIIEQIRQNKIVQRNAALDTMLKKLDYDLKSHSFSPSNALRKIDEWFGDWREWVDKVYDMKGDDLRD